MRNQGPTYPYVWLKHTPLRSRGENRVPLLLTVASHSYYRCNVAVGFTSQAFDQLEQADQEAMLAEREAQRARKRMEERRRSAWVASWQAVERSFEEVRCQRRERFMECFHKAKWDEELFMGRNRSFSVGFCLRRRFVGEEHRILVAFMCVRRASKRS